MAEAGVVTAMAKVDFSAFFTFPLPSTSSLWFIDNECVVNEGASIVTDTVSGSNVPVTENRTVKSFRYPILA